MKTSKFFGNQEWSTTNLNVDHFSNGDLIHQAKSIKEWKFAYSERIPAWCYYENDEANGCLYGKLYNWYAIIDSRGICPVGWHIPTDDDWNELIEYIGGYKIAGRLMKSKNFWQTSRNPGSNESGFCVLLGGYRNFYGEFFFVNLHAYFWSSSEHFNNLAWYHTLDYLINDALKYYNVKGNGFSCRGVKNIYPESVI